MPGSTVMDCVNTPSLLPFCAYNISVISVLTSAKDGGISTASTTEALLLFLCIDIQYTSSRKVLHAWERQCWGIVCVYSIAQWALNQGTHSMIKLYWIVDWSFLLDGGLTK